MHTHQQKAWGSDRFRSQIEALTQRAVSVRQRGRPRSAPENLTPNLTPFLLAFDAMMEMRKIDIATSEAARRG